MGGTSSVLGGGKFANGAITSAFQHLFNEEHPKINVSGSTRYKTETRLLLARAYAAGGEATRIMREVIDTANVINIEADSWGGKQNAVYDAATKVATIHFDPFYEGVLQFTGVANFPTAALAHEFAHIHFEMYPRPEILSVRANVNSSAYSKKQAETVWTELEACRVENVVRNHYSEPLRRAYFFGKMGLGVEEVANPGKYIK